MYSIYLFDVFSAAALESENDSDHVTCSHGFRSQLYFLFTIGTIGDMSEHIRCRALAPG